MAAHRHDDFLPSFLKQITVPLQTLDSPGQYGSWGLHCSADTSSLSTGTWPKAPFVALLANSYGGHITPGATEDEEE